MGERTNQGRMRGQAKRAGAPGCRRTCRIAARQRYSSTPHGAGIPSGAAPLTPRRSFLVPDSPGSGSLGLCRWDEEVRHAFSENLRQRLQRRERGVAFPPFQAADMHVMQTRALRQPPLTQASALSPVLDRRADRLSCHGNVSVTRPAHRVKWYSTADAKKGSSARHQGCSGGRCRRVGRGEASPHIAALTPPRRFDTLYSSHPDAMPCLC